MSKHNNAFLESAGWRSDPPAWSGGSFVGWMAPKNTRLGQLGYIYIEKEAIRIQQTIDDAVEKAVKSLVRSLQAIACGTCSGSKADTIIIDDMEEEARAALKGLNRHDQE